MKLQSITAQNFQILTHIHITPAAPVVLIAGPNEQGKSSLHDALRMAMTSESARVKLKKDYGAIVRDGAKDAKVKLVVDDGLTSELDLPAGKLTCTGTPGEALRRHSSALPYLLDPARFAAADENVRRAFLVDLAGIGCDPASVKKRLLERGCAPKKVEVAATMLRSGFDAAHKEAKEKAKDARAGWKAITGEVYGDKKAVGWKADSPTVTEEQARMATAERDAAQTQAEAAVAALSTLEAEANAARKSVERYQELNAKAERKDRIHAKLQADAKSRDEWLKTVEETRAKASGQKAAPLACPHCAGLVSITHGVLVEYQEPEVAYDAEAAAKLPEYESALHLMESAVRNGKRDLQEAIEAEAAMKELAAHTPPAESAMLEARSRVDATRKARQDAQEALDAIITAGAQAAAAAEKTEKAQQHHLDTQEWEQIADALAPDGIPGELLADALKPLNDRLRDTSIATGWAQVTVDSEMVIRIGGRPYSLGAESAKWRADAAMAEAISHLSGLKFFALDRFDVLDTGHRIAGLKWLHGLAERGDIDTAVVFGTFKALPSVPTSTFHPLWIERGEIIEAAEAAA